MKYKYILTSILLALCSSLIGQKPKVVSSASMFTDMVMNIGGNRVEALTIVPIGGDPHLHTPSPRDAKLVTEASLILINGLTFEGWINELIENSGTKAKTVLITKNIKPISSDTYKNSTDPHAWMDVNNGRIYILNIMKALQEMDPVNAEYYKANYIAYDKKLAALDRYIFNKMDEIPRENRILITSHDAFKYYGKRYALGLEAIMGISTDAEVQTSDITRVSQTIKQYNIPAVFIESTINPKLLQQIAEDNDIIIGGSLYADSLGDKDSPASTYIDMLTHNTNSIVNGLTGRASENIVENDMQENPKSNMYIYGLLGFILLGGMVLVIKNLS